MTGKAAVQHERMSLDDFEELLLDKPEDEKWELINGRVFRGVVGARWEHHAIIDNVGFALTQHLRQTSRPCRVFRETFYLKRAADDLAALPDLMVRCGPLPPGATSLEDPIIAVEVVSPGSETKDRVEKRIAYQRLPSLRHYVLIARDRMFIDVYHRDGETWRGDAPLQTADALLQLPALDFGMPVGEVYRGVSLAEG